MGLAFDILVHVAQVVVAIALTYAVVKLVVNYLWGAGRDRV